MSVPFWDTRVDGTRVVLDDIGTDNPWDTFIIVETRVPGISKVKATRNKDVDVKKPKGAKGAAITFGGDSPADVSVEVQIWTPAQWEAFQRTILPLVDPPKPEAYPAPLTCQHPELALKRVKSLFFTAAPDIDIENGIGTVTLKAKEWFAKPKKVKQKKPPVVRSPYIDVDKRAYEMGLAVGPSGLDAIDALISPNASGANSKPF